MKRSPRHARHAAIAALFLALISVKATTSWASCQKSGDGIDVAVGLRAAPPFISADSIRGQRGLNFDLWMSIEREFQKSGLIGKTEFVECPLADQLRALAAGDLDLVISPLTITAERMDLFDFTHQYLSSGITVAQRSSSAIDFGYAIGILRETVTHRGVARAILIFLVINLVLAAFMARVLRREHDFRVIATESIPVRFYRYTMEAVVRTIGLKGIGDGLRSTATRTLEVFMAVVGTALSAAIFGVLTTALVGSIGGSPQIKPGDLPKLRVATLANSTSQAFVEQLPRDARPVEGGKRLAEAHVNRRGKMTP
jgi:ABC-type amino acid transport substrate-binding protein